VTLGLGAVVLASMTQFFQQHARRMRIHTTRVEVQQALRASLDAITRDIRLAGACLPQSGQFIALTGTDGATDSITIRAGVVKNDLSCLFTDVTAFVDTGAVVLPVSSAADFAADQIVYVRDSNGSGELRVVSSVNVGGPSITLTQSLGQQYPVGSGVYAVDERVYSVDDSVDPPVLRIQVNRAAEQNFAAGISDLQFVYVLDDNCPPCDMVTLDPMLTTAQWWLVNEIIVTATAETIDAAQAGTPFQLTQVSRGKPRNLLP
jgi:hypothetical protein